MHFPRNFTKITALFLVLVTAVLCLSGCSDKYTVNTSFAMGSVLTAKIFTDEEEKSAELFTRLNSAVQLAENALSNTKEDAEIYNLNKDKYIYGSEYLRNVLMDTVMLCNILNRKVDITIGKVTSLWGFNTETPSLPSEEDIEEHIKNVSVEKILIGTENAKVTIEDDVELDMGAVGKGAACDAVYDELAYSYTPYIITLGGTVAAYMEGPDKGRWTVGIRDPFGTENDLFGTLSLSPFSPKNAVFVSTSGSYEKSFTEDGKTYHHILDTKTGYPVESELVSVTVVAHSGLNADALSTACFAEGLNENSLSWLSSFFAEAVFIFSDKTYYATDGLKDSLKITADGFTLNAYTNEN